MLQALFVRFSDMLSEKIHHFGRHLRRLFKQRALPIFEARLKAHGREGQMSFSYNENGS